MALMISYPSAYEFWMRYSGTNLLPICEAASEKIPQDPMIRTEQIQAARRLGLSLPLHVMVPSVSERSHGRSFICHVMPKNLPRNSFVQLSKDLFIVSPECCFLLAAAEAQVPDLAVIATDLCSIYCINEKQLWGQESREQITSIEKIRTYMKQVKNIKGARKATSALGYAFDRSNSAMESKLAVITSLPCMYGGYGLPRPELNYYVSLSPQGSATLRRSALCCDMVWKERNVVVEYDSDLAHSSQNQVKYDKRRSSVLNASGFKVIHVTYDHFSNDNTIDDLFELIRITLGVRSNKVKLNKYKDIHFELVKKMFLMSKHF